MQKYCRKPFVLLQRDLMIKTCFYTLLLVAFWSCAPPPPPEPKPGEDVVEKSIDEMSEVIVMAPYEDPVRRDSLLNEIIPLLLTAPSNRALDDWFTLKARWRSKYGAEENIQLYAELAFDKFLKEGDILKAAKVKLAQGRMYYLVGKMDKTIAHIEDAYDFAFRVNDSTIMGWSLAHLSGAVSQTNSSTGAKDYNERGMQIARAIGNTAMEINLIGNKAAFWHQQNNVDSALHYVQLAVDKAKRAGLGQQEILLTSNQAFILLTAGRYDEALELLEQARPEQGVASDLLTAMLTLTTAEAYLGAGRYEEAYEYILRGCKLSEELEVAIGITSCKLCTAQYYEQKGDLDMTVRHYKDYYAYEQDKTNEEVATRLAVMEAKRSVSLKERQIYELRVADYEQKLAYERRMWSLVGGSLSVLLIALVSFLLYRSKERLRLSNQQKIAAEAKLNVLQSQMNPHFIYNALSGIQNFILHSKKIEAFNYLSKFAGLLRIITKSSTEIFIELEREVELLSTYLDLEKLRFRDAFDYALVVDDNLRNENLRIPSMMIQPVVENAIIHGLSKLKEGQLSIKIQREGEGILCIVTDNGRGREAAIRIANKNKLNHLSVATVNGNERIESLHSLGYAHAKIEIDDLYDGYRPLGTRVRIYLPFK